MNINEMKAGCELDELVAEKVMGWHIDRMYAWTRCVPPGVNLDPHRPPFYHIDDAKVECPKFSTDIVVAWEVVEKLADDGDCPGLIFDDNGHWALSLEGTQNVPIGPEPQDIATTFFIDADMWADSAPLAICRAALKAVGVGV